MNSGSGGYGDFGTTLVDGVAKEATNWFMIILIISIVSYIVLAVGCVFLCRYLAKNKNLSTNYMWFGLLTIIGVIIVAVMSPAQGYNPYGANVNGTYYNNPNMYNNQNVYNNQNMYNAPQGIYNNVQGMPQMLACPTCGAALNQTDAFCMKCGSKVK